MAKIVEQKYTKADGTRAVYGYLIPIPKSKIQLASIDTTKPINIKTEKGKLIITN